MSGKKHRKTKGKRSYKNLKINTRIILTTVLAIVIPVIIIVSFSTVLIYKIPAYLNISTVTTNTYGTVNQLQWAQTLSSITGELSGDNSDEKKLNNIDKFVTPLEEFNSLIYIEKDGEVFYSTRAGGGYNALEKAKALVDINEDENLNYFGDRGLIIVNHANCGNENFLIVIVNEDYAVNDVAQRISVQDFTKLLLSRMGIVVVIIVILFIVAIVVISFITTKTIVNPIRKISRGAEEISRGNLDYEIEYSSTNELGQLVDNFNNMSLRLKEYYEKQNKAEEERKVLVAGIAHDLRTPLTSVKGYAEGLADGIADTPEKKERYLKTICESINDTEKILDDLLTVSKLELNGLELSTDDVSAKEFFLDATQEIKHLLDNEGFDFIYEMNCSDDTIICIDTDRFARVIYNIISNSIKYAREDIKGEVRMCLNEYEYSIILEVSDNGIGVDKKSLPKIFDTMYRADPARTKVSGGSGLGLSICRQIVELHGGSIWASSRENEGLSVFISLPKKEKQK